MTTKYKRLEIRLSPAQYQALVQYAEEQKIADITNVIRKALTDLIPAWPDDLPTRGKYKRQNAPKV